MILSVKAILIIAISVLAWGVLISLLLDRVKQPYLLTISGDRHSLILARAAIWLSVIGLGVAAWFALLWVMPSMVALAIFFGFEAGALDICGQRIRYVYVPNTAPRMSRASRVISG